jgi:YD repeat-containing protein
MCARACVAAHLLYYIYIYTYIYIYIYREREREREREKYIYNAQSRLVRTHVRNGNHGLALSHSLTHSLTLAVYPTCVS